MRNAIVRSFSLIEVVVTTVVISLLALVIGSATLPLHRAASISTVNLDMDRVGRKVLSDLRRELRQSGWGRDGVSRVTVPAPGATTTEVSFQMCVGPDDVTDWSSAITYKRVDDGTFKSVPGTVARYRVTRDQDGVVAGQARNVSELTFTRSADGRTIFVHLELLRPNTQWREGQPPGPYRRVYEDRIELLNGP